MSTRKSMKLPVIITLILIVIVVYLFANIQQERVVCEKTNTFDNDVKLTEYLTTTVDNNSISSIHLVKRIVLPSKYNNEENINSIKYSLENTLDYLGKDVKYTTNSDGLSVTIDIDKNNELVLLDNIEFFDGDGVITKIDSNTTSNNLIVLRVGDKYSTGSLMKKFKNNNYSCR